MAKGVKGTMIYSDVDNQRYLNLAQMILILGLQKDKIIYEKQKFMIFLFFLKEPIFLERLVEIHNPKKTDLLNIKDFERYNLIYEEKRISVISPNDNLLISYLESKNLIETDFCDKGFIFKLTKEGENLFKDLNKKDEFKEIYKRAKVLTSILGKTKFEDIKKIIIQDFREISI
jgi:hypothetical protein